MNGGFLHYMDMKKFLKNHLLRNHCSDFETISQEYSLGDPFQTLLLNFDLSVNMAVVKWGFLHYMDMKKFLKNLLLQNCCQILKYTTQNLLRITFLFNDLMLKTNRLKKDFFYKDKLIFGLNDPALANMSIRHVYYA